MFSNENSSLLTIPLFITQSFLPTSKMIYTIFFSISMRYKEIQPVKVLSLLILSNTRFLSYLMINFLVKAIKIDYNIGVIINK